MQTVVLPRYFNYQSLYNFTASVVGADGLPIDKEFIFDFRYLSFIDGSGLTVLCNTLEWLYSHNKSVFFQNHENPTDPIRYLDDCGFFKRHLGSPVSQFSHVRSTTLPFTKVEHADAHGWLQYSFTPWLSNVLGVSHGALGSVRACVKEIFNNILDHSSQTTGFVHVQHYPNLGDVRITVSDFGKGIPANIREMIPGIDDARAILRATDPGFTTKSHPRNMGAGLDYLVASLGRNQGSLLIYSFQGALHCRSQQDGTVERIPSLGNGSYPGTLVEIRLPTDRFVGDDEEEEQVTW